MTRRAPNLPAGMPIQLRRAVQKFNSALADSASPTFAGVTLTGLTASRLVQTNAGKALASVADLSAWIAGTANRVTVANDGDGTITLSGPQDLHTGANPTFAGFNVVGDGKQAVFNWTAPTSYGEFAFKEGSDWIGFFGAYGTAYGPPDSGQLIFTSRVDGTGGFRFKTRTGGVYQVRAILDNAGNLNLPILTASRLLASDGSKNLASSNLVSWVAGTANEVEVSDDGDGTITLGLVDPVIVSKGGTGAATLTDHGLLVGSGTDAVTPLAAATNGQIPIGSAGADPVLAEITGTANQVTVTNGAGTITLSLPQNIHTGASPTFAGLTLSTPTISTTGPVTVLSAPTTTSVPTILGYDCGTGTHNILIGYQAGKNLTGADPSGTRQILIGYHAGYGSGAGNSGNYDVAIGYLALENNTSGAESLALGAQALRSQTSGANNVGIGGQAGRYNATGSSNVSIGQRAGLGVAGNSYSYNTFIGTSAGQRITTGSYNVFIGNTAGWRQTTISGLFVVDVYDRSTSAGESTGSILYGLMSGTLANQTLRCNGKFGVNVAPLEEVHANDTVRADIAFNLNGTDGVTQAASAGKVSDVTALAGGIATAQTQVTPIADGGHALAGITTITTVNGRITAMS